FLNPVDAGHVTIPVLVERRREHGIPVTARARKYRRDACPNRSLAGYDLAVALDERYMSDSNARNVRDRIHGTSLACKRNSQIAAARPVLCRDWQRSGCEQQKPECQSHKICFQAPRREITFTVHCLSSGRLP